MTSRVIQLPLPPKRPSPWSTVKYDGNRRINLPILMINGADIAPRGGGLPGKKAISNADVVEWLDEHRDASEITVIVHSAGGQLDEGEAIYNTLRSYNKPVITRVPANGACFSAATLVFLAGDYREAAMDARFMLHQCEFMPDGRRITVAVMERNALVAKNRNKWLAEFYAERCCRKRLDFEIQVASEAEFSADRALELGMVHSVIGSRLRDLPENLR